MTEKALKIGGSRRRSGGEGSVKMGEADVLMPEKVVESLLGENGDLIQVLMMTMMMTVMMIMVLMMMINNYDADDSDLKHYCLDRIPILCPSLPSCWLMIMNIIMMLMMSMIIIR